MLRNSLSLSFVLALALAQGAAAQDTSTSEPAAPGAVLSMGEPAGEDGVGKVYVAQVSGDWELRCVKVAEGKEPCQLYQLLKDDKGNSVAEVNILTLPEGQQAVAGATIVTPMETLLTEQLTLQIGSGEGKRYPFAWCAENLGCVVRLGFTADEVAAMKKGSAATVTIVPLAAPDQRVGLTMSLTGFTAGFDALVASAE